MADCDCIEQLAFLVQKHGLGNILLPLIKHAVGQEFDLCSCAVCWPNQWSLKSRLFYFYIFQKYFLLKYIFNFTIYSFIPLPPGRGAAGGLPPVCGAAGPLPPPFGR